MCWCVNRIHIKLFEYLIGNDSIPTASHRKWNGKFHELITFRYCNNLPIKNGEEVLHINWAEVTITNTKTQEIIYHNSFITDIPVDQSNVEQIIQAGKSRWKVENENNNVLKTKGYHLVHNFGHGKQFLSSTLLTLNLLAFLSHIFLEFTGEIYWAVREELSARKTFFHDFRTLTKYLYFHSWHHLISFMAEELEVNIPKIL